MKSAPTTTPTEIAILDPPLTVTLPPQESTDNEVRNESLASGADEGEVDEQLDHFPTLRWWETLSPRILCVLCGACNIFLFLLVYILSLTNNYISQQQRNYISTVCQLLLFLPLLPVD